MAASCPGAQNPSHPGRVARTAGRPQSDPLHQASTDARVQKQTPRLSAPSQLQVGLHSSGSLCPGSETTQSSFHASPQQARDRSHQDTADRRGIPFKTKPRSSGLSDMSATQGAVPHYM
ncbi:hypothetical protein NDU88_003788 [Pleurodeles waltl]|uniref:Uncharacterized protein n=1 Tax=Pleurodeles waltl TaxID=8319 RepID=A0AAV7PAW2_PLEWA|nr:hypothetical protein NDU88_003788 [Pleurodeles waltl]